MNTASTIPNIVPNPMYHSFIADESQVREFYRRHILPYRDESYLNFIIIPIARRKYWAPLSKSQMNMNTKVFSSNDDEDRFVNELRRYEVRCGLYKDTFTKPKTENGKIVKDQDIPDIAIAFYVTANPMNDLKAFFLMQREVSEKLEVLVMAKEKANSQPKIGHISSIFKSCLHKCDQKVFLKLDVDTKEADKIESLKKFLREHAIKPHLVVESRGGYHVLLKRSAIGKNHENLHRFIESTTKIDKSFSAKKQGITKKQHISAEPCDNTEEPCDLSENIEGTEDYEIPEGKEQREDDKWITVEKNALVIIPGTFQGGFITRIVDFD